MPPSSLLETHGDIVLANSELDVTSAVRLAAACRPMRSEVAAVMSSVLDAARRALETRVGARVDGDNKKMAVTKTEAMGRRFKLKAQHLAALDFTTTWHSTYRSTLVTLYDRRDVYAAALAVHGVRSARQLDDKLVHEPAARAAERRRVAREKRERQLEKVLAKLKNDDVDEATARSLEVTELFLDGYKGMGIRRLATYLLAIPQARGISNGGAVPLETLLTTLVEDGEAAARALVVEREMRRDRRARLELGLAEHGLVVRKDSRMCREFIESGEHGLERVVDVMRNMDFLHRCTEYRAIMRRNLDAAYETARMLGERYDDFVDYDAISLASQREAVRRFTGLKRAIPPGLL